MAESLSIIKWDKIRTEIETSKDIDVLLGLKDKLRAYQVLAEQSKQSEDVQAKIGIYKARADRKCGEWLTANVRGSGNPLWSHHGTIGLSAIGVTKQESHRLQKIARIPQERFDEILQEAEAATKKITSNMLYSIEKAMRKAEKKEEVEQALRNPGGLPRSSANGKYRVFYADPPWQYNTEQHCGKDQETTIGTHYTSMPTSEICALPIPEMTEDNAVCFLWATSPLLQHGLDVLKAWGFTYKSSMIWDKVKHNVGYYVSVRHEFLLIGTKGKCTPDVKKLFDSVLTEERTIHSRKPEHFRTVIDKIYPLGARVELFAREATPGWDAWGNQL